MQAIEFTSKERKLLRQMNHERQKKALVGTEKFKLLSKIEQKLKDVENKKTAPSLNKRVFDYFFENHDLVLLKDEIKDIILLFKTNEQKTRSGKTTTTGT